MRFYSPAMLVYWMGDTVLCFYRGRSNPVCFGGIKLMQKEGGKLRPECLYIGEPAIVTEALSQGRLSDEATLIVCSGEMDSQVTVSLPDNLTLIETNLTLVPLYNCVHEHVHRFQVWDEQLRELIYTNASLEKILQHASSEIHATILLVNAGYKQIAAVECPGVIDSTAGELLDKGYLSFDTVRQIHKEKPVRSDDNGSFVEYVSQASGNYTIVHLIRHQGSLAARLCVILNSNAPNLCYSDLSASLAGYISDYMFSGESVDYSNSAEFSSLVADLIECRLTDKEELEQRLKQIKLAVRRYYQPMLVTFENDRYRSNIPWNYIINQLERIFPYSNITTYRGEILLIIRKTKRGINLMFDAESLTSILDHYNGYAAIGNASEFLTSLPPVYHQAKDALRLGRIINPERRILYYEDYSFFQIIELSAESARHSIGSRNLVHLCNNEIIALLMYDKKNGDNLVQVMYTYLQNERNTTKTAKALYIHRNTMLYKIHKIESVIGESLDNHRLRERLMFSYHVLEYMTHYCKEDILVLKRNSNDDDGANPAQPARRQKVIPD